MSDFALLRAEQQGLKGRDSKAWVGLAVVLGWLENLETMLKTTKNHCPAQRYAPSSIFNQFQRIGIDGPVCLTSSGYGQVDHWFQKYSRRRFLLNLEVWCLLQKYGYLQHLADFVKSPECLLTGLQKAHLAVGFFEVEPGCDVPLWCRERIFFPEPATV